MGEKEEKPIGGRFGQNGSARAAASCERQLMVVVE